MSVSSSSMSAALIPGERRKEVLCFRDPGCSFSAASLPEVRSLQEQRDVPAWIPPLPDPKLPAYGPCSAYPDASDPLTWWSEPPFGACPGVFSRSVLQRRDEANVCSLLDPRSAKAGYLQKLMDRACVHRWDCPQVCMQGAQWCQWCRPEEDKEEKAHRLRAEAWDLKDLECSKVERNYECIFIMVGGWIMFCYLRPWNI